MDINILSLSNGAKIAKGITVIIDVYRAFTTQSFAFENGIKDILNVSEIEQALDMREKGFADYCMGEIGGIRPDNFDFGNSPFDLKEKNLKGKTIIHCTMNGTTGAKLASKADLILGGALINAKATVDYIKLQKPEIVSLVAMGARSSNGEKRTEEDELCAIYMKSLLEETPIESEAIVQVIDSCKESKKFGDPLQLQYPLFDKLQALRINEFDHAILLERSGDYLVSKIQ